MGSDLEQSNFIWPLKAFFRFVIEINNPIAVNLNIPTIGSPPEIVWD
jgi:hypothetical protein